MTTRHTDLIIEQALALNQRYMVEVVEAFGLCPWAKGARTGGRVAREVILQEDDDVAHTLRTLSSWAERPEVEIGLLIFPCLPMDSTRFRRFVNQVIEADAQQRAQSSSPFALAAFHPLAKQELGTADRLVPYLRKTPDPTIQAVSVAALDRVRGEEVSGTQYVDISSIRWDQLKPSEATLRERIGANNHRTVRDRPEEIDHAIDAILQARRRTHPPWLAFETEESPR